MAQASWGKKEGERDRAGVFSPQCMVALDRMLAREASELVSKDANDSAKASLQSIEAHPGWFGGTRWLVTKKEKASWATMFGNSPFAPQGDPRWIMDIFGPELATLLGFEEISENALFIPSVEMLNGFLDALGPLLHDQVQLRFNPLPPEREFELPGRYLAQLAGERKLAFSSVPQTMLHEIAFHASAIFIPNEVWDVFALEVVPTLFDFKSALEKALIAQYPGDKPWADAVTYLLNYLEYFPALTVDGATATLTGVLVGLSKKMLPQTAPSLPMLPLRGLMGRPYVFEMDPYVWAYHLDDLELETPPLDSMTMYLHAAVEFAFNTPHSMQEIARANYEQVRRIHYPEPDFFDFKIPGSKAYEQARDLFLSRMPEFGDFETQTPSWFATFLKDYINKRGRHPQSGFGPTPYTESELCQMLVKRIEAIQQASLKLQKTP